MADQRPSTRTAARTFINWARSNRSAGDIEIPARTARSTPLITHEARLDLLRRCLVEEPDTLTYRVAAALLLLYAQPMSRVAAMRIEQINVTGERLTLVLGNEPAEVRPPFADLLLDLGANRPNLQTGNAGTSPWLFPSTRPGQHLHPNTITIRLRAMGIELLGARNAALRELVQLVPPPIVASQLGYSPASLSATPASRPSRQAPTPAASAGNREPSARSRSENLSEIGIVAKVGQRLADLIWYTNSIDSNTGRSHRLRSDRGTLRPLRLGFVSFRHPANPDQTLLHGAVPPTDRLACVRAGSRSAVWAPQGGDGQMQVPRTQHVSGCRECGAGSVLGTPVATTGRATKKENHHDDSTDGQRRHCRRRP